MNNQNPYEPTEIAAASNAREPDRYGLWAFGLSVVELLAASYAIATAVRYAPPPAPQI